MTGLALMRRSYREGSDASLLSALHHQRSTSLPPKRSAAAAAESNRAMEYSLGHSTNGSHEENSSVNEPTWFSHAFHGSGACSCGLDSCHHECNGSGNNPANNDDPADDEDDDSSMESMELASGSEFHLRPTTTAPGSNIGINGRQTITANSQASVSSITLGSNLAPSSKLVPGLLNNKQNSKECEQSVNSNSTASEDSTASSSKNGHKGSISKRMRGRSLGIPFSRKNKDKKNRKDGDHTKSEESNEQDQKLDKYLSSKKSKEDNKKKGDKRGRSQSARDRSRLRDRSRSIVSDMRSFIHSIDGSSCCDDNSISLATSAHTTANSNDRADGSYGKEESIYTGTTYRSSFSDSNNDTPPASPSTSISSRHIKQDNKGSFWNKFKGTDQEKQIISELHENNLKNECTIEQLRDELANLTNERNAFRTNSDRLMEVMTRQKEEIQNEMHNEQRDERLRMLERDIDRILNSNSSNDGNNDASFKSNESTEASSLPSISDMESRLSSMAAKYEAQIKHLESQNKTHQDEVSSLKEKIEEVQDEKDDEVAVVRVLENKLSGCKIIIESMKEEDESIAASVNDELVAKLGDLAEENGSLLSRCQRLERELEAAKSKEVVGRKLVAASKASIEETTRKVDSVQQTNEEYLSTIVSLRSENKALGGACSRDLKHAKQLVNQLCQSLEGDSSPSGSDMALDVSPQVFGEEDDLLTLEEITAESKALHESLVDAIKSADQVRGRMTAFAKTHDATINDYEDKVTALNQELDHGKISMELWETEKAKLLAALAEMKEENSNLNGLVVTSVRDEIAQEQQLSTTTLDALKLENGNLRASMKEMNSLVQTSEECAERVKEENASLQKERWSFEQELMTEKETNQYLREETKNATADRENAYETCKVLQQEINVLRQSVSDSMERTEVLMSLSGDDDDSSHGIKEKFDALMKANDLLNKQVKQKNEALEGVRTVLENLKADQATVKKTIVALRQENARLKEGSKEESSPRTTPRPPSRGRSKTPPPPRKQTSNGSYDSAKVTELESRIKRVENENQGLKDANSTLSIKLFDEMEKTDALRVANDGLAARICKLVTFIQENAQGKQKLTQSNSSGSTSKKSSKNPVVTQSPHSIVLKKSSSNPPVVTPMTIKKKKKTSRRSS
eukprot:scaffold22140_cov121-Skeletonema_marinoi.AAC.1